MIKKQHESFVTTTTQTQQLIIPVSVQSSSSSKFVKCHGSSHLPKPGRLLNRQRRQPTPCRPTTTNYHLPTYKSSMTTAMTPIPDIPKPTHSPRDRQPAISASDFFRTRRLPVPLMVVSWTRESAAAPHFFRTRGLPIPLMVPWIVSWTWEMVSDYNAVVVVAAWLMTILILMVLLLLLIVVVRVVVVISYRRRPCSRLGTWSWCGY
jgi:hypothetical protein